MLRKKPVDKQKGKLFVVGIGPGGLDSLTNRAQEALQKSEVVVGYKTYINLISSFCDGKAVLSGGMGSEQERCEQAIREALTGKEVALVSSGDSGIYGMAGLVLEIAKAKNIEDNIEIEIVPGVPAFVAAASLAGAPIMNDFAVISLSDLLTPWEKIKKRLSAAASGDFVVCLYNPKSKKRVHQIEKARDIFLQFRDKKTPCAVLKNISRPGQIKIITTLDEMLNHEIDMLCVVIIGNSETQLCGKGLLTPRGYEIRES
jgi:precorrin-3B C17-methyltransferase